MIRSMNCLHTTLEVPPGGEMSTFYLPPSYFTYTIDPKVSNIHYLGLKGWSVKLEDEYWCRAVVEITNRHKDLESRSR